MKTRDKVTFGWFALFYLVATMTLQAAPDFNPLADAIFRAEGGSKTHHPYGILATYQHTTPRQACLNTIAHAWRDWNGNGDFIAFLGNRYCPVGAANDPTSLNRNWIHNVKSFLPAEYKNKLCK